MNIITKIIAPLSGLLVFIAICYFVAPTSTVKVLKGLSGMGGQGDQIVQQVVR